MIVNPEKYLITASGRIKCIRCKAQSVHTKKQCGNPALKGKTVCKWHGGMSTGPKTLEGIQRIRDAHWKHGKETKKAKARRSEKSLMFAQLEDAGWELDMFSGKRTSGRKPKGYKTQSSASLTFKHNLNSSSFSSYSISE